MRLSFSMSGLPYLSSFSRPAFVSEPPDRWVRPNSLKRLWVFRTRTLVKARRPGRLYCTPGRASLSEHKTVLNGVAQKCRLWCSLWEGKVHLAWGLGSLWWGYTCIWAIGDFSALGNFWSVLPAAGKQRLSQCLVEPVLLGRMTSTVSYDCEILRGSAVFPWVDAVPALCGL